MFFICLHSMKQPTARMVPQVLKASRTRFCFLFFSFLINNNHIIYTPFGYLFNLWVVIHPKSARLSQSTWKFTLGYMSTLRKTRGRNHISLMRYWIRQKDELRPGYVQFAMLPTALIVNLVSQSFPMGNSVEVWKHEYLLWLWFGICTDWAFL